MNQKDNTVAADEHTFASATLNTNDQVEDLQNTNLNRQLQSPAKDQIVDNETFKAQIVTPNVNESSKNKQILIHSVDQLEKFDFTDHQPANPNISNSSLIPKLTGLQQQQSHREINNSCFNDSLQSNSKNLFESVKIDQVAIDTRMSPPKSMIGSGIGQGTGLQRAFNLRGPSKIDSSQKYNSNGCTVPVSQITLSSNPPSLTPSQQQSTGENFSKIQSTQQSSIQQSLSQKRGKNIISPRNQDSSNKFQSQSRSKSFKKQAMFSSVTSGNQNQNQISDEPNFEFNSQRKAREEIDQAYKTLNKDDDSESGRRSNSGSRSSSLSNNGESQNPSHLFENQLNQQDNVKVCIRVRPLNHREQQSQQGRSKCVQVDQGTILLERGFDTKKFNFDFVGNEQIDQATIFNHIAKPMADSCMQGYNGTIFAYGQTGSGKTFTIQGPVLEIEASDNDQVNMPQQRGPKNKEHEGIIQRSFQYIFQNIQAQQQLVQENSDGSELNYLIKCSYLEIYNEQIMDLLEPTSINLSVREDIKKGVYVEGLKEEIIGSYRDMLQLTLRGFQNRHVGSTAMNRESSRSHSVLTTIIESKSLSKTGVWNMKTSRFHIIDLAGSERSKNTNAMGERLKEAGMINKSLSALGNVINSLVERSEGKGRHIPYRDSKLTFILRDSLGGNSKTVIIANVSPSTVNLGETLSTLEFAKRAKQIKNKAVVNEDSSGTILILKNEIKRLKKDLTEQFKKNVKLSELNHELKDIKPQIDMGNFICKNCRISVVMDQAEQDAQDSILDDSLLIDDLNEGSDNDVIMQKASENDMSSVRMSKELRMSKEFKFGAAEQYRKMKTTLDQQIEKTKKAENLLALNLKNLTAQQLYYEGELQQLQQQYQAQTKAFEALSQQKNADKMKLKLREDKISKLESEHSIVMSDECLNLQQELKMLQEQLESEREELTNPKVSALKAQLVEAQSNLKKLSKDLPSKIVLFSDQNQMIDKLSEYLNSKGSIEAIEQQEKKLLKLTKENVDLQGNFQSQQDHLNDLQKQYDILLDQNVKAEEVNQRITREYGKSNVEIRNLKDKIKHANNQISDLQQLKNEGEFKQRDDLSQKEQIINEMQLQFTEQIQSQEDLQQLFDKYKEESCQKYEILANELDSNKKEANSLKQQLEEKLKLMFQKDSNLNERDQTMRETIEQLDQLKKANQVLDEQTKEQQNDLKQQIQIYQQKENLNKQDIESKLQIINDLQKEVANLSDLYNKLLEDNEMKQKIEKAKEDQYEQNEKSLRNELNDLKQQKQQVQIELDNSKEQNSQIFEDHQQLLQDHESVMKDQSSLLSQYEALKILKQSLIDQYDSESKSHTNRQEKLTQQASMANAEVLLLTKALKDKEVEISKQKDELMQQIEKKQSEYDQNIKQLQIVQQEAMSIQIKQMEEKIVELKETTQTTIQEKDNQIQKSKVNDESQQNKITQLNSELNKLYKEKEELSVEFQNASASLMDLEKKQEDLETQNKAYQSNISYLDVSVEQMQSTIQQKASDHDRIFQENQQLQSQLEQQKKSFQNLNDELVAAQQILKEKCEVTQGQDQENAETQVLLLEANNLIQIKDNTIIQQNQSLESAQLKIEEISQNILQFEKQAKQQENDFQQQKIMLQKLEVEKDNLQFKRDDATKLLEQKVKDLKQANEELSEEITKNNNSQKIIDLENKIKQIEGEKLSLSEQLEIAKQQYSTQHESNMNLLTQKLQDEQNQSSETLAQICQEKEDMAQMLQEQKKKEQKLLEEVGEMQTFIDNLSDQLNNHKQMALEVDLIKQDCYKRIASIQEKQVACLSNNNENLDQQKQKIKDCVAQALAEIADVSQYQSQQNGANERQIEVSLLVSQIVCEFSKLYENQIVLEKKKASHDYKKYSDKCEKQKAEIKVLQDEKGKVNQLIVKAKEKDAESNQLKEQIDRLKHEFQEQMAHSIQSKATETNTNTSEEQLTQKINTLQIEKDKFQTIVNDKNGEINGLNENIKQIQKQIYEQKQLYEVRVQSQEQEIEQHQFRYRELERKVQADIQKQEGKFAQVQEQVHILAQSTKQSQIDKEGLLRQIQEMEGSAEQNQRTDEMQKDQLNQLSQSNQLLQQQVQQRETEMAEVVQSLKQFAEANRQLEAQLNVLRTENEQLAGGHKNPNQKIQFHMKIKEENNKLRADNFRLQEDLQRKIETIYKQQQNLQLFEQTTRTLKGAVSTTIDPKADSKLQREFNTLIQHITSCQQFSKIARAHGVKIDNSQPSHSTQQIMDLISVANDALENSQKPNKESFGSPDQYQSTSQTRQNNLKGVPPRHVGHSNILSQSKSSQNLVPTTQPHLLPNGYGRTTTMAAISQARGNSQSKNVPLASSSKKKLTTTGGGRKTSELGRDSKNEIHQAQYQQSHSKSSKQQANNSSQPSGPHQLLQGNNSQRQVLQPHVNNYAHMNVNQENGMNLKNKRPTSTSNQQLDQSNLMQGHPVVINSYSSLYKQSQQQQMVQMNNQPQYQSEHVRMPPANSPFILQQANMGLESQEMFDVNQMQNQQFQQQIATEQQFQQQHVVPGGNYSALNSKHKQYKQAQSQKSTHLASQRSKSRQGLIGSQLQDTTQKALNQNYEGHYSGGYIE